MTRICSVKKHTIVLTTIILILIIVSFLIVSVSPWGFDEIASEKYELPSQKHLFGTDYLGRDILVRLSIAFLVSICVAVLSIILGALLGSVYGVCAGYCGGKIERIMVAIIDILQCIPEMLIAIFLMVVVNSISSNNALGSILGILITLVLVSWPIMARVAKNETKVVRQMEYVVYSKIKGAHIFHIIFFHIIPNIKNQLITVMAQRIPKVILVEAFLSYVGIGIQPPFPSLGKMINDGISVIRVAPHVILFPTLTIVIMVVLFNLLCESIR